MDVGTAVINAIVAQGRVDRAARGVSKGLLADPVRRAYREFRGKPA